MNEWNEIEICIDVVLVIYSTISPTGSFIQPIETTHHLKRSFWSHWWRQGITPYGFKSLTLLFSWTVQNGLELKKKITIFLKKFFNGVILNIQRCRPTKVLHSAHSNTLFQSIQRFLIILLHCFSIFVLQFLDSALLW